MADDPKRTAFETGIRAEILDKGREYPPGLFADFRRDFWPPRRDLDIMAKRDEAELARLVAKHEYSFVLLRGSTGNEGE